MIRVAVAGKELTAVGLTVQVPASTVSEQLRDMVLAKPSWEAIETDPFVFVLSVAPAFTWMAEGRVRTKSGLVPTVRANEMVTGDDAPAVVAWMVTG